MDLGNVRYPPNASTTPASPNVRTSPRNVRSEATSKTALDPLRVAKIVVVTFVQTGAITVTDVAAENVRAVFVVDTPTAEPRYTAFIELPQVQLISLSDNQAVDETASVDMASLHRKYAPDAISNAPRT